MDQSAEQDWLCDHGVRRDHKGRIIARLPLRDEDFLSSSDDSMTALQIALRLDEDETSVRELMRRDVDLNGSGARGRRRRQPAPKKAGSQAAGADDATISSRIGRPAIGVEVRVYVQTSIARSTRETLSEHGVTLAQVFDECARQLVAHE